MIIAANPSVRFFSCALKGGALLSLALLYPQLCCWATVTDFAPFLIYERDGALGEIVHEQAWGPMGEQPLGETASWSAGRPLAVRFIDDQDRKEFHLLYPLYNLYHSPQRVNWDILEVISGSKATYHEGSFVQHFSIFPIYFSRHSSCPAEDYHALFPIAGKLPGFFGLSYAKWVLFPLYAEWACEGEVRHGLPWPFIQWQTGNDSQGFALWPLAGYARKEGKHKSKYALWPLLYNRKKDLDQPIPTTQYGFLPFFTFSDSAKATSRNYLWPFFGYTMQYEPAYHEKRYFWPLLVQGRGEQDYVNRWAPIYTYSSHQGRRKKWVLWPLVREKKWREGDLMITQNQFLYFLVWTQKQQSISNSELPQAEKTHVWPLYSFWDNGAGQRQFQLLSPFEAFFQDNRIVRRLYSPLFALYRYSQTTPGYIEQNWLFSLVSLTQTPTSERFAIGIFFEKQTTADTFYIAVLKGLFGYRKQNGKKTLKIFWVNINLGDQSASLKRYSHRRSIL